MEGHGVSESKKISDGDIHYSCMDGCGAIGLTGGLLLVVAAKVVSTLVRGRR
jgi:hypothetical protein